MRILSQARPRNVVFFKFPTNVKCGIPVSDKLEILKTRVCHCRRLGELKIFNREGFSEAVFLSIDVFIMRAD